MGKKYIIELEEPEMFDERKFYTCTQMPWWALSEDIVENLAPYTEPDTGAIREEAFKSGYNSACKVIDVESKTNTAYQKALNDLWEAMQKAIKMYCEIDNEVFLRVFYDVKCDWGESVLQALFKSTPKHLIDSIREYEERKTKVEYNFEEVKDVIETTAKEYNMSLDEIAAVLQKMRGSE